MREPRPISMMGRTEAEPVNASAVSGNMFQVLEARPALGRFFTSEEDAAPGANPVAVLSHAFWTRRFNADPSIVGRSIVLDGAPFTVVGVAAEKFQGPFVMAPDLWVPITSSTLLGLPASIFEERRDVFIIAVGRLAPNVGLSQAQADLSAIAANLARQYPDVSGHQGVVVMPSTLFPGDMRAIVGGFMAMLLVVAGLVLIIASTNVAGMVLARAVTRRREIAVRLALGASRAQLITQLVIESLLVFAAAGLAGLLLAKWLVAASMTLVPRLPVPLAVDAHLDWRVLSFALAVSLITGLVTGVVPALQSTRPELVTALKVGTGGTAGKQRMRLRSGLLVTQLAFSMLLLIVAGLFARTLARAGSIDPGFDPRNVHITSLDLGLANYTPERGRQVAQSILERARAVGGVRDAAMSAMLNLDDSGLGLGTLAVPGREAPDPREGWRVDWNVVTPGYFGLMGIPLVRGRDFSAADRAGGGDVAILNETFAAALFPGENPVGHTLTNNGTPMTVIGVARNAKYRSLGDENRNFIYVPLSQQYLGRMHLLIKTRSEVPALAGAVKRIVTDVAPAIPVLHQQTMTEQTAVSLLPQRIAMMVSGGLGAVALLLALLGIYGVTAFSVAQRTREIGVRIALGAQRTQVFGLVLRQATVLAAVGVTIGALAAVGATRLLGSLLYGVPPTDLVAFAGAAAVLAAAALLASWIPARRAARVDPVTALRTE
jgi:predicted permease